MSNSSGQLAVINLNPLTLMAIDIYGKNACFWTFFCLFISICNLKACLSFHKHHVSLHLCTNQIFEAVIFWAFPFSPFFVFLLQLLDFYWVPFSSRILEKALWEILTIK